MLAPRNHAPPDGGSGRSGLRRTRLTPPEPLAGTTLRGAPSRPAGQ